jgi:hypothetical protein
MYHTSGKNIQIFTKPKIKFFSENAQTQFKIFFRKSQGIKHTLNKQTNQGYNTSP